MGILAFAAGIGGTWAGSAIYLRWSQARAREAYDLSSLARWVERAGEVHVNGRRLMPETLAAVTDAGFVVTGIRIEDQSRSTLIVAPGESRGPASAGVPLRPVG